MKQNQNRKVRIPDEVKEFGKAKYKKYKKENKEYFDSKKEMKESFYSSQAYNLQYVIDFLVQKKHLPDEDIQEIKGKCYAQIAGEDGEDFVKYLKKAYKNGDLDDMENIQYLPILLYDMIAAINKQNSIMEAENPEAALYDPSDLYELSELIMGKKLKKMEKKGINHDLAFDILSVVPAPRAMKYSPYFRVKSIFDLMYQHASKEKVEFAKILKLTLKGEYDEIVVGYALQERKEKYERFNDSQKALFNDISEWVFNTLEDMDAALIKDIIKTYVKTRKRDAAQGKDGNRRYFLSSLPETLYPRICKAIEGIKAADSEAEKYL